MLKLFNFHPVSTKFRMNIENIILTNRLGILFLELLLLGGKLHHKLGAIG